MARSVFGWGCVLAVGIVLLGSWVPFHLQEKGFDEIWAQFVDSLNTPGRARGDLIANTLIGVPLAFLFSGWLSAGRTCTSGMRLLVALTAIVAVVVQGMVCELGQGWISDRVPSARDVIAQTVGGIGGAIAWVVIGKRVESAIARSFGAKSIWTRFDTAIAVLSLIVLVWSVLPLNVMLSPAEYARKWSRGGIELVPFTRPGSEPMEWLYQWVISALITVPLGIWAGRSLLGRIQSLWERRVTGPGGRDTEAYGEDAPTLGSKILAAIAFGSLPELLQIPIAGRVASSTDALFGIVGAAIGIWLGSSFLSGTEHRRAHHKTRIITRPSTWFIAALGYWIALCLVAWFPFDFVTDRETLIAAFDALLENPFSDYRGSNLRALFVFGRLAFMSAGFGVLLGLGVSTVEHISSRKVLIGFALLAILASSTLIEFGQLLERSHSGAGLGLTVRVIGSLIGFLTAYRLVRIKGGQSPVTH